MIGTIAPWRDNPDASHVHIGASTGFDPTQLLSGIRTGGIGTFPGSGTRTFGPGTAAQRKKAAKAAAGRQGGRGDGANLGQIANVRGGGAVGAIVRAAGVFGLDPAPLIANAIAESNLDPNALGDGGRSRGLFQLFEDGELRGFVAWIKKRFPKLASGKTDGEIKNLAFNPQLNALYSAFRISQVGGGRVSGASLTELIVRKFEKPFNEGSPECEKAVRDRIGLLPRANELVAGFGNFETTGSFDIPDAGAEPVGKREFRQRRSQFRNLNRDLKRGSRLGIFGEPIVEDAERAIRQLRKLFKDGVITEDEADRMDKLLGTVTGRMTRKIDRWKDDVRRLTKEAMDAWRKNIRDNHDDIVDALGDTARQASAAFDRETNELLDANRARLDGLTAAEAELERLRQARDSRDTGREIRAAHDELQLAQESGDPERIRDAQRRLEDARLSEHERALQLTANVERDALRDSVDREDQRIRDERELIRRRFEERLQEVVTGLKNEDTAVVDANTRIIDLIGEFVPDWNQQGALLGEALAEGLRAELADVDRLINEKLSLEEAGPPGRQTPDRKRLSFPWFGDVWTKTEKAAFYKELRDREVKPAEWAKRHPELNAVFLARGGLIKRPIVMGEAGTEAILPLTDRRAMRELGDAVAGARGGGRGSTVIVNNSFHATVMGASTLEIQEWMEREVPVAMRRAIQLLTPGR